MRKICRDYENPFDNYNIDLAEFLCPFFKKLNFTPNYLTTISLVCGLLSSYYLWNFKPVHFAIFYYLMYLFDCIDGHYARKYNMCTELGDFYDHVKDVVIHTLTLGIILHRYKFSNKSFILIISLYIILTILMFSHLGCQELIYQRNESPTIGFCKDFIKENPFKAIKYTKLFGCGTWIIFIILLAFYINFYRKSIIERRI
jgi:phosphatidylglycerophosphate synthase